MKRGRAAPRGAGVGPEVVGNGVALGEGVGPRGAWMVMVSIAMSPWSPPEPVVPTKGDALITNSAKYAHYAPGLVRKRVHFHGLEGCIEAARTGVVPEEPRWLKRM